jgi:hypothetical protein
LVCVTHPDKGGDRNTHYPGKVSCLSGDLVWGPRIEFNPHYICQFPILINYHDGRHHLQTPLSTVIGQNPCWQSMPDNEKKVDKFSYQKVPTTERVCLLLKGLFFFNHGIFLAGVPFFVTNMDFFCRQLTGRGISSKMRQCFCSAARETLRIIPWAEAGGEG